jgi:hypothetical protein
LPITEAKNVSRRALWGPCTDAPFFSDLSRSKDRERHHQEELVLIPDKKGLSGHTWPSGRIQAVLIRGWGIEQAHRLYFDPYLFECL